MIKVGSPRVCRVCGHEECPGCEGWCDEFVLVPGEAPPGEQCCGGACQYMTREEAFALAWAGAADGAVLWDREVEG